MIVRVWENARRARTLARVVVATDDERVARVVRDAGGEAVLTDPAIPSGTDRVLAAARILAGTGSTRSAVPVPAPDPVPDIGVNIQGDEPLLDASSIDAAVGALESGCDVATLAAPLDDPAKFRDPNCVKVVLAGDGTALYFSRAPIPFPRDALDGVPPAQALLHVGLYAFRYPALERLASLPPSDLERIESLEQLRWLTHGAARIAVARIARPTIAVDTPEDVLRVEKVLSERERAA